MLNLFDHVTHNCHDVVADMPRLSKESLGLHLMSAATLRVAETKHRPDLQGCMLAWIAQAIQGNQQMLFNWIRIMYIGSRKSDYGPQYELRCTLTRFIDELVVTAEGEVMRLAEADNVVGHDWSELYRLAAKARFWDTRIDVTRVSLFNEKA